MKVMRSQSVLVTLKLVLVALFLTACATAPYEKPVVPKTPNEILYAAQRGYEAVLTAELNFAPKIPKKVYEERIKPRNLEIEAAIDASILILKGTKPMPVTGFPAETALQAINVLKAVLIEYGATFTEPPKSTAKCGTCHTVITQDYDFWVEAWRTDVKLRLQSMTFSTVQ